MKLVLSLGIALALSPLSALAQNVDPEPTPTPKKEKAAATPKPTAKPAAKPTATPAPTPAATPDKKAKDKKADEPAAATEEDAKPKPSFWQRLFGRKDRKPKDEASATATPTPSPTPKPKPKPKRPAANADTVATPDATPLATPASTPRPRPTPKATDSRPEDQLSNQVPFVGTENEPPVSAVPDPADEAAEKAKYKNVRAQALEDPRILKLQDKADSATTASEAKTASKAYYKALFNKMRELDGTLKDRIDRMESATMKRIEEGGTE